MSKIHLEIEIPGNAKTYEFVLDDRMKIGTAKEQIKKQIAELEGHDLFAGLDNIVFGSLELEGLIQDNETFREVGIKNGSRECIHGSSTAKTDAVKSSGVHQQEQEESMAENKMEMDPEVLRTTARKVETSAGDVRKELKRFTSVIEGLSSTWSSEVKDRFLQNYQKDRAALLEMAEQYTEVAEGLLGIADELEQTEEEISSQIRAAAKS